MVALAKALSGGLIPSGALLMSDAVYESVYGSLQRAIVHTSTYSENSLAMRAGLATLEVWNGSGWARGRRGGELSARAFTRGAVRLRNGEGGPRRRTIERHRVQGAAKLRLRIPFEAFQKIHPGMFGQVMVMRLFRGQRHPDADLREQFHGAEGGAAADGGGQADGSTSCGLWPTSSS